MAIPVGRVRIDLPAERLPLYGARTAAFAAYVGALTLAVLLVNQALGSEPDAAVASEELPPAQLVEARAGDSLAGLAAQEGVSVSRLLALNPDLGPLGPEPGQSVRVR
jgi:LysM repeat protein